jgi:type IV pilus assembly protein PilE
MRPRGFTLIELMVAVAIVAILAAIALPSYSDYVVRSKLPDGVNALTALRARMEQFYQDNRTYVGGPCATQSMSDKGYFTLVCSALSKTAYTITATGGGTVAGFGYTIDQDGTEATSSLPTGWGSAPASGCWITHKGEAC